MTQPHLAAPFGLRLAGLGAALAAALLATALPAQVSVLKGHSTNAPIDVAADRMEVRDAESQAMFAGNVVIRQGGMTLSADSVTIFYTRSKTPTPEISRIDAQGAVKLVTASETAAARYGIYDVVRKTITLVGNVELTRAGSVLRGQRLAIDLATGRSTLDGAGAAAKAGAPATSAGRVTGRFLVPQRPAKQP
ncbi:MAG: LptA/OstA family protein [Polymorphobacter sp.]